jgi:heptosyltransferase-2
MTHLAEAAGRDVITLYGPTSRELGYYPVRPGSFAVELPLPCRPCTRMGEGRCTHPRHLACLEGIEPAQVLERVLAMIGRRGVHRGAQGRARRGSRPGERHRARRGARP